MRGWPSMFSDSFVVIQIICFFGWYVGDVGICIRLFGDISAADKLYQIT